MIYIWLESFWFLFQLFFVDAFFVYAGLYLKAFVIFILQDEIGG